MSIAIAQAVGNSLASALATAIGAGSILELRSGAKPGPDAAAGGTLLASITISGSFTATNNVIAAADPASAMPVAAGTCGHFRLKTSGGTSRLEGTVTAVGGGGDLELTSVALLTTVPVDLGVPQFTVPLT